MHNLGRRCWWLGLLTSVVATNAFAAPSDTASAEIVVAMRYLQQTGTSHAHLYLYREDGKLLRQLTKDDGGQDHDPVFAPDGETIVFTRQLLAKVKQWWSIEPRGGNLRQLDAAPDWYTQTKTSPGFEHIFNGPPIVREPRPTPTDARAITTPDGNTTIKIVPAADVEDPGAPDRWNVLLRTGRNAADVKIGDLAGYSAGFLSRAGDDPEPRLMQDGAVTMAFCFVHLNSTDGNTVFALDLRTKRLVRLSPNMATPIPLSGEAAFLAATEERYIPFGDGAHTGNCSYTDRWDANLKRVRYARKDAPGICYGASMYRPGKSPAIINIRYGDVE